MCELLHSTDHAHELQDVLAHLLETFLHLLLKMLNRQFRLLGIDSDHYQ